MNAMRVVVIAKFVQLSCEIKPIPEQGLIEILASDGANQALDERVRNRHMGNRFDLINLEHAQVGQPPMKAKQRVVIRADVLGYLSRKSVSRSPVAAISGFRLSFPLTSRRFSNFPHASF